VSFEVRTGTSDDDAACEYGGGDDDDDSRWDDKDLCFYYKEYTDNRIEVVERQTKM